MKNTFTKLLITTVSVLCLTGCSASSAYASSYMDSSLKPVEVNDKKAPDFQLSDSEISVLQNSEFKPESYIKNDAGLTKLKTAPANGSEFKNGWYTITSNVDTKKAGSYTVKYHAVGNNGVATDLELKVTVEESKDTEDKKDNSSQNTTAEQANTADTNVSSSTGSVSTNNVTATNNTSPSAAQPVQDNSVANITGNDTYNGVLQTPGCKKTTVHHDAITKESSYEEWVEDKPAWYEQYITCNCGLSFATADEGWNHIDLTKAQGDTTHKLSSGSTYHEAEGHYETKTRTEVLVPAYDEQVCE